MPDITLQSDWKTGDEIRLVAALSSWGDENALFNAFAPVPSPDAGSAEPAAGRSNIRLMARVNNVALLADAVRQYDAHVVLVDHRLGVGLDAGELLVQTIQKLRHLPERPVVCIGVCYEPAWAKTFEEAGAFGTISGPITSEQIQRFVALLPQAILRAYQERQSPNYIAHFSDDAVRAIDSGVWQRRSMTFWSTKGGVGKTWLSVECAVALGVKCDRRTLLIDADMNCGDVATFLKLPTDRNVHSLATAFAANQRLTPLMVEQHLLPWKGNLKVLVGAWKMKLAGSDVLNGARGAQFAQALVSTINRMGFDFVVWDLGQSFHHPLHLVPLVTSDINLMVVTPERTTLLEMELALPDLRHDVQIPSDLFRLVVNRWSDEMGVTTREIASRLGYPIFGKVPYGKEQIVDLAIQHAQPLVLQKPNDVSNALIDMLSGFYRPIELIWRNQGGAVKPRSGLPLFKFGGRAKPAATPAKR